MYFVKPLPKFFQEIITGYLSNIYNFFTYEMYHTSKQGDTLQTQIV